MGRTRNSPGQRPLVRSEIPMSIEYVTEKREFVRIQTDIPIRYKFLSKSVEVEDGQAV